MKKSLKLLVIPAAMIFASGNLTSCAPSLKEVAMISDVGDIDDGSFNQSCWEGVKSYCTENNITYDYYRPFGDSDFARKCAIKQAVAKGAKLIILPGFKFATVAKYVQTAEEYKDVKFVLMDEDGCIPDGETVTHDNFIAITYDFVYSGWLAGYAVAMDYYKYDWETSYAQTGTHKLHDQYGFGFVGGNAYPSVYPFGFGFIEGVLYASEEFTKENGITNVPVINFKTSYAGVFMQDDLVCANVKGWLTNQTEPIQCVFPCGGKLYQSITEAVNYYNDHNLSEDKRNFKDQEAPREAARWIGVDGDQYILLHNENDKRSIYTSALKDLGHAVKVCISRSQNEYAWQKLRHPEETPGKKVNGCFKIGLNESNIILEGEDPYDYVGIPLPDGGDNTVLRSCSYITKGEILEKKQKLIDNEIKIYSGTDKTFGEPGVFKSLASDAFKQDTEEYNVYASELGAKGSKYQNYTIE